MNIDTICLWLDTNALWFWLGAIALFGLLEANTAALVSIWLVIGAIAALLTALAGASVLTQWVLFLTVSAIALAVTRPLAWRLMKNKAVPTNADRVLDTIVQVTETIDNGNASGTVYAGGKTWTARSADGKIIPKGTRARVNRIEGVKLIVEYMEELEPVT